MKANTTTKMMVLVAIATMAFLSMTGSAVAAPPPAGSLEMASPLKQTAVELMKMSEFEIVQPAETGEPADGPAATDPTDGDLGDEHVAQPDEFEDLPAGSEGDAGEDTSDESVDPIDEKTAPVVERVHPAEEATQPPILVVTTTQSTEETPTYTPHRDHLAFTGGGQIAYLLGGLLIIAIATGVFFLGGSKKQGSQS